MDSSDPVGQAVPPQPPQGNYRTREHYYKAFKQFCAFLSDNHHLQKLENISGKHLTSYVLWMQESSKSASTIKTDLAAVQFFYDRMSQPKYQLLSNEELAVELERRCFGGVNHTWYDSVLAFYLVRYAGLRIHECFRTDTAMAEQVLRENAVTIKGGKARTIPINGKIAVAMREQSVHTPRGQKLLVPDGMPTDQAINHL